MSSTNNGVGDQPPPSPTSSRASPKPHPHPAPLHHLLRQSRNRLQDISSSLSNSVFPLSNLPRNRHHQQVARAIAAITLAQSILKDAEDEEREMRRDRGQGIQYNAKGATHPWLKSSPETA